MDAEAKAFWSQLNKTGFQHSSHTLPGEGWTVWIDQIKLTSLNRSRFNELTQSRYSTTYWQHANKLDTQMDLIDWNSIGIVRKGLTIRRQIWMTKWATGWLPTGRNMKRWNQWPKDQCPVCEVPNTCETVEHLLLCTHTQPQSLIHQHILRRTEELSDLTAMGIPVFEFLMAMFQIPYCQQFSNHLNQAMALQQTLGPKWTARGCISMQWKKLGPSSGANCRKRFSQWVPRLLKIFWQTAWEVWQQRNEIVHKAAITGQTLLLYQEVQKEYQKGTHLLPAGEHHWVSGNLPELLQRSTTYLRAWLQTVTTIRQREQRRQSGSVANRSRRILRQFLGLPA